MKQTKTVLERFQVLKSYADSLKELAEGDKNLANELAYRIIQYGIYGTEPPEDSNYLLKALWEQIKNPIDTCRSKASNAKKSYEKAKEKTEIKEAKEEIKEYWNPEINECLEIIKKYNNGIVDWTQKSQRQFWKHLINKLKTVEGVENWKYSRQETLEIILKITSGNKFYVSKITSPENIYRNLWILMQACKQEWAKTNLVIPTI